MGHTVTLQCPRCGNEQRNAWFNRQVCCACRIKEEREITRTPMGKAWLAMNKALRSGEIVRAPCEVCGAAKVDAHHDDYAKPLDVRWLCRSHHKLHHAKAGPGLNAHAQSGSQP